MIEMSKWYKEKIRAKLAGIWSIGKDVYLRADDHGDDVDYFKKQRSYEDFEYKEDAEIKEIMDVFESGNLGNRYDVECDSCGNPIVLSAKGVNAVLVTEGTFCSVVKDLIHMGYERDDYFFVLFTGKNLGKNLVEDGNVVVPVEVLAQFYPVEMRRFCVSSRSRRNV